MVGTGRRRRDEREDLFGVGSPLDDRRSEIWMKVTCVIRMCEIGGLEWKCKNRVALINYGN